MSGMKNENIFLKFKKHSLSTELMHNSFKKKVKVHAFADGETGDKQLWHSMILA